LAAGFAAGRGARDETLATTNSTRPTSAPASFIRARMWFEKLRDTQSPKNVVGTSKRTTPSATAVSFRGSIHVW